MPHIFHSEADQPPVQHSGRIPLGHFGKNRLGAEEFEELLCRRVVALSGRRRRRRSPSRRHLCRKVQRRCRQQEPEMSLRRVAAVSALLGMPETEAGGWTKQRLG